MLKAKLFALCACPALLTPPVILAVHKPARHAVARMLHHTADRLDDRPRVRPAIVPALPQYAELPCAPVLAGGDLGGVLPAGLTGLAPGGLPLPALTAANDTPRGFGGFGGGGFGGGGGGGGFGGGGGGGGGTTSGAPATGETPGGGGTGPVIPVSTPVIPVLPVPGSGGTSNGTVPEPAAWALMITGFALIGGVMRFTARYRLVRR